MRRFSILGVLLAALVAAGSAQAATLTLRTASAEATVGERIYVAPTAAFSSSEFRTNHTIAVFLESTSSCGRTSTAERARSTATYLGGQSGVHLGTLVGAIYFTAPAAGEYLFCGYLYPSGGESSPPSSLATVSLTVYAAEAAPTLTGPTSQSVSGAIVVSASCPRPCTFAATATVTAAGKQYTLKSTKSTVRVRGVAATRFSFRIAPYTTAIQTAVRAAGTLILHVVVQATYPSGSTFTSTRDIALKR